MRDAAYIFVIIPAATGVAAGMLLAAIGVIEIFAKVI
jgi:hypothetical protein